MQEELLNQAASHRVHMAGQKCFENLLNLLDSDLEERLVFTFRELTFFQCIPPLQNPDYRYLHASFAGGSVAVAAHCKISSQKAKEN